MTLPKLFRLSGDLKQRLLACVGPVVTHFALKTLHMGPFGTKADSKMGQKVFSKKSS